jgi:hypothetical protein
MVPDIIMVEDNINIDLDIIDLVDNKNYGDSHQNVTLSMESVNLLVMELQVLLNVLLLLLVLLEHVKLSEWDQKILLLMDVLLFLVLLLKLLVYLLLNQEQALESPNVNII